MSGLPRFSAEIFLAGDKSIVFDFKFLWNLSRKVVMLLSFQCGCEFLNFFTIELGQCIAAYFPISKQSSSVNFLYCPLLWSVLLNDSWTASYSMFPRMISFWDRNDFGSENKYVQIIFMKLARLKIWTLKRKQKRKLIVYLEYFQTFLWAHETEGKKTT